MLKVGDKAPDFALVDSKEAVVSLKDFSGKRVVLYFYPKDNTPGCTIEATEFTALAGEFAAKKAVVVGVSRDSSKSHERFVCGHGLGITLLSDHDHVVIEEYGAWQEKVRDGKRSMGIARSTFLIGTEGKIVQIWPNVKAAGHARAVLDAL